MTDVDQYLHLAKESAMDADEKWQPPELLSKIATYFAEDGQKNEALSIWLKAASLARACEELEPTQDSYDCASVLSEIAVNLAHADQRIEAERVANMIKNDTIRNRTLQGI